MREIEEGNKLIISTPTEIETQLDAVRLFQSFSLQIIRLSVL